MSVINENSHGKLLHNPSMRICIDTSALVRYFTKDEQDKADLVEEMLEKEARLYVPEAAFPELEYVLGKQYAVDREGICLSYRFLNDQKNIRLTTQTRIAIEIYLRTKLDMADCLIAAHSVKGKLASFDRDLLKLKEVKPYWR